MRLMSIASLSPLVGLMLAGCAEHGPEQVAAQAQAQVASDDAQCRSYGALPGSPGYVQCRMNLDNQHAAAVQQTGSIRQRSTP